MPLGKDIRSMYMYLFNKLPTRETNLAVTGPRPKLRRILGVWRCKSRVLGNEVAQAT
jgi:hypothetical protein